MFEFLQQVDTTLFFLINGTHHPAADWFFRIITNFGSGWIAAPLLITLVLVNIRRERIIRVILCGALGLTLSGVVNSQIKHLVHRARPAVFFSQQPMVNPAPLGLQKAPPAVRLLGPAYRSRSFPSGHTNTAFAAALFCSVLLGGWWFATLALALAVGYSRVYLGVHFPLDVATGALLGAAIMLLSMWKCGCIKSSFLKRDHHAE